MQPFHFDVCCFHTLTLTIPSIVLLHFCNHFTLISLLTIGGSETVSPSSWIQSERGNRSISSSCHFSAMFSFFKLTSKPNQTKPNQTKPNQTWVLSLLMNGTGSTGGPALAAPVKNFMGRVGKSHFRFSRQLMKVCKKDWVEAGATYWGRVKILRCRVQLNRY